MYSMNMYCKCNGKQYAVVTPEEYFSTCNIGGTGCYNDASTLLFTNGWLYPIYHSFPTNGILKHGCYCYVPGWPFVKWVTNDETYKDFELINLMNPKSIDSLMSAINRVNQIEKESLTPDDTGDIFKVAIQPDDSPIMVALKKFICEKNIDLSKYSDRFGINYTNDVRILNKNDITIKKFLSFINYLDGTCEVVINNSSDDTPNPIKNEIRVKLV